MSKKKKLPGVVVDIKDPRKAMIDAGWGGSKPDRSKRTKPIPWLEDAKKIGTIGGIGGAGLFLLWMLWPKSKVES